MKIKSRITCNIIIIVFITLVFSCEKNYEDYYKIESINKIIKIDEIYEAKIYLLKKEDIDTNIQPVFYIISNKDTFYLPFNVAKYCAIYRGIGRETGDVTWNGILEYKTKDNKNIKILFSDTYKVE